MDVCLRPADSIHYKSPLSNEFVFLDRLEKGDYGLDKLYRVVNVVASFLIPQPEVPRALLAPELVSSPVEYLPQALVDALRDLPRVTTMLSGAISLALVFPVFGLCLLTCRCCCGACGGGNNQYERRCDGCWRCICFFSLGICCGLMTFLAAGAIIADMYTYSGISALPQYPRRVIQDLETGYLKTLHEIDTLLLDDYAIFEKEMKERLDGCSKAIGEDIEGILAVNPAPLAKKLVDHIVSMNTAAEAMKETSDEYLAVTSALATKAQFVPGKSSIGNVTAACTTLQTLASYCDGVKKVTENLQKQTSNFSQLTALGKAMSDYTAMLQKLNAAQLRPVVDKASNPTAKDDFMKATDAGVKHAKDFLQKFGDDLGDKANTFYFAPMEFPEDLEAASDKHIVGNYKKYQPFVLAFAGLNAAVVCVLLLCTTMLYMCGLVMVAWAPAEGCCNYRSGRWCFSLGACMFVLLFGFIALVTTAGLLAAIMATRCGCALAADLQQPGIAAIVRYLFQLVQVNTEDDSTATKLLSAVGIDYLFSVVKRFGACNTEPRSAYRLLGEPFVRNASKAIGYEKTLSFLWEGFDRKQLEAQLQFIGGSSESTVNLSALSALAATLKPLLQFQLNSLHIEDIKGKVEDISTKANYAEELKTALEAMKQQVPAQMPLTKDLTDAIKDAETIETDLNECDLRKKILQDALNKMKTLMEVDSKPVDVFKSEIITAIGDTQKVKDAINKVNVQIKPYKENILKVVQYYAEYVVNQRQQHLRMKDTVGNCAPAYTIYLSTVSVVCDGVVRPFSGFWFFVASFLAVGIVAMFMALCMSTLYSRKPKPRKPAPVPEKKMLESFAVSVMPKGAPAPQKPGITEVRVSEYRREVRKSSGSESMTYIPSSTESSASSCSCIFSDTSTRSSKPASASRRSKDKKKKPRERRSSSRSTTDRTTRTSEKDGKDSDVQNTESGKKKKKKRAESKGKTRQKKKNKSVKKEEKRGSKKLKKDVNLTPSDQSIDIKYVIGDKRNEENMKQRKQMNNEKKRVRHSQSSMTDVRVLLYDPPASGIARALRSISHRVASVGRSSSILQSVHGRGENSVSTRLFERYQVVEEDVSSSQAALQW